MIDTNFYLYKATVVSVYDGDTVTLMVDQGFRHYTKMNIRLYGINTPEVRGESRPEGLEARDYLQNILPKNKSIILESLKDKTGKYGGRWIGTIFLEDGTNINNLMVKEGYANEIL